jgi:hypothetical protein
MHESRGSFNGHDFTSGTYELGQIHGSVARPGPNVENTEPASNASLLPTRQHDRPPDGVLYTEASQLLVMSSQDVILFRFV